MGFRTKAGWARALLGLAIAALAVPVSAEPPAIVTRHSITVAGRPLEYSAEAGRIAIRDVGTGEPLGHIFYVAYRVAPSPGKTRPLAFIWNGGPGLPAASTEFEGFGPRRIEGDHLVDNDDTLLTDADLVFVDPVGTGFSRAVSAAAQPAFTSIVGDVAAATEFVRAWVLQHGDEATPLILSGQSYGSGRAGSAAYQLLKRGFKVRGLALISNSSGLPQYPGQDLIATAMHVGDYAVAAHYYHKLSPTLGATPEAVRRSAEDWARRVYLPSLRRLASLSVAQRRQVAVELARHTGLAVSEIDIDKLIVTQGFFLGHLVPGKLPYYSDYRIFEPFHAPPLTIGLHSLRHDLGYHSDLPYLGIETLEDGFAPGGVYPKSVNALWLHSTVYGATPEQIHAAEVAWEARDVIGMPQYGANLPGAAEAIKLDPRLRVLVAHAAYDPLGGCSIDAELGRHLEPPFHEAIGFRCYLAGHAIYRDAPARALFADDLRRLARLASGETP